MAGVGISYKDVVHAANTLQAEGHHPTIERIRQQLGTGSHTTITKHLNSWRQQQEALSEDAENDSQAADIVKMATEQAWQNMRRAADVKINKIKDETQEQLAIAEDRLLHALEAESKTSAALEQLTETLHALQAEHEIQRLDLRQLQQAKEVLTEKNLGLETRLQEHKIQTAAQLEHLNISHAAEMEQSKAALREISVAHLAHLNDLQVLHEEDRHVQMLALDEARTLNKLLEKDLMAAHETIIEKNTQLIESNASLAAFLQERNESLAMISEQQATWQTMIDKSLISDTTLAQLQNWPTAETRFAEMEQHILSRLNEFENIIAAQQASIQALTIARKKGKVAHVIEQN